MLLLSPCVDSRSFCLFVFPPQDGCCFFLLLLLNFMGGVVSLSRVTAGRTFHCVWQSKRKDEPSLLFIMPFPPLHDAHGTSLLLLLFYCTCCWYVTLSLSSSGWKACAHKAEQRLRATTKSQCEGIWMGLPQQCLSYLHLSTQSASSFSPIPPFCLCLSLFFPLSAFSFGCWWAPYIHVSHSDGNLRDGGRT